MFSPSSAPPNSVIVFYRVTCPTCKFTLPFLHRIDRKVIGVSQDDALATAGFTQQFQVKIESIIDAPLDSFPLSNAFEVHHVPTLFVIGENGIVTGRIEGFDKEALEELGITFQDEERVPPFKPG